MWQGGVVQRLSRSPASGAGLPIRTAAVPDAPWRVLDASRQRQPLAETSGNCPLGHVAGRAGTTTGPAARMQRADPSERTWSPSCRISGTRAPDPSPGAGKQHVVARHRIPTCCAARRTVAVARHGRMMARKGVDRAMRRPRPERIGLAIAVNRTQTHMAFRQGTHAIRAVCTQDARRTHNLASEIVGSDQLADPVAHRHLAVRLDAAQDPAQAQRLVPRRGDPVLGRFAIAHLPLDAGIVPYR